MKELVFDASVLVKPLHQEPGTSAAVAAFEQHAAQPMTPDWAMLERAQMLRPKAQAGDLCQRSRPCVA